MKSRAPAFMFYPRQFAGDDEVMSMDLDTVGAHILLICAAAASPECSRIAADEQAIRTRLRNPSEENWLRIKNQLLRGAWKIDGDGKWWLQEGLQRTFEKQRTYSDLQTERANKRYRKPADSMQDVCRNDTGDTAEGAPKTCFAFSFTSLIPQRDFEAFRDSWNELRGSLAEATRLTAGRKKKLQTRLSEGLTLEAFRSAVATYAATPFLRGENDRKWKVDFDWLIENDGNIAKVTERKYGEPKSGMAEYLSGDPYLDDPAYAAPSGVSA
jgi:hypothetical protein